LPEIEAHYVRFRQFGPVVTVTFLWPSSICDLRRHETRAAPVRLRPHALLEITGRCCSTRCQVHRAPAKITHARDPAYRPTFASKRRWAVVACVAMACAVSQNLQPDVGHMVLPPVRRGRRMTSDASRRHDSSCLLGGQCKLVQHRRPVPHVEAQVRSVLLIVVHLVEVASAIRTPENL